MRPRYARLVWLCAPVRTPIGRFGGALLEKTRLFLHLLVTISFSTGCVTQSRISVLDYRRLDEQKWVSVELMEEDRLEIANASIMNDSLVGTTLKKDNEGARVAVDVSEISALWIKQFDAKRTVALVGIGALVIYVIGLIGYRSMT